MKSTNVDGYDMNFHTNSNNDSIVLYLTKAPIPSVVILFQDLVVNTVSGKEEFPLTLSWLSGQPPEDRLSSHDNSDPAKGVSGASSFPSFPQVYLHVLLYVNGRLCTVI